MPDSPEVIRSVPPASFAEHPAQGAPEPGEAASTPTQALASDDTRLLVAEDVATPGAGAETPAPPDASGDGDVSSTAAELARLADTQAGILEELGRLRETFSLKIRFDEAKERVIDTLNEEVQRHRQGLHFSILRPLFLDLITLYDDLLQCAGAAAEGEPAARTFQSLADTVEEVLARNGVSAFSVDGDAFDGKRQRAVRTAPADDPAWTGRVAQRLRRGFAHDERILRPEHVSVYRHEARDTAPPGAAVAEPAPASQPSAA
jgi:molecular chaperone GrpE